MLSSRQFANVLVALGKDGVLLHILCITLTTFKLLNGHDNQNSLITSLICTCVFYDQHFELQEACSMLFMTHTQDLRSIKKFINA